MLNDVLTPHRKGVSPKSLTANSMDKEEKTQVEETKVEETEKVETTPDPSSEKEEKPLAFHEHPRFKELIEEKNTLANQVKEMAARLEEVNKNLAPKEQVKVPSWLQKSVGENPEIFNEFNSWLSEIENRIEQKTFEKFQSTKTQEQAQAQKWEKYVNDSVAKLQADGKKFDRNELLAITEKYLPTDVSGNIDFEKAYELYEMTKAKDKPSNEAQKKVAGAAGADKTADTSSGGKAKTFLDFKGKTPW